MQTTRRGQSRYADASPQTILCPMTNTPQIAEMYQRQALAQSKGGKKGKSGDGDDGFW